MRKKDYTGWHNGILEVTGWDAERKGWKCQCECGNKIYYTSRQLQINRPKSCGCLKSPNIVGKKYGRLTVVAKTDKSDSNGNRYYDCLCKCGNHKLVTAHDLNCGTVKSCGCLAIDSNLILGQKLGEATRKACIDGTNVNNLTSGKPKTNTSGTKGVTWDESRQKWVAQLCFKQKRYFLGRYSSYEDAVKARKAAEEKYYNPMINKDNFSKIKKARTEKGLTQKALADLSGVPYRSIQDWETGRRNPKDSSLMKIAEVLEVGIEDLKD